MKKILVLCLVGAFNISFGQEILKINLSNAIDLALEKHDALKIKKMDREIAKAQQFSARSALFPTVEASYGLSKMDVRGDQDMQAKGMPRSYRSTYESGSITLSQPVFTFGKIYRTNIMANKGVIISGLNIKQTEKDLKMAAEVLYYSALYSREMYKITKESYQNALSNQRKLNSRLRNGRAPKSDIIKMKADIAQRIPYMKQAKIKYESDIVNLKEHLRIPLSKKIQLVENSLLISSRPLPLVEVKKAKLDSPNLNVIHEAINVSDLKVTNTKSDFLPTVGAFVSYEPTRFALGNSYDWDNVSSKNQLTVGIQATISFGGGKIGSYKEAVATRVQNQYALALREREFERDLQNYLDQYSALLDISKAAVSSNKLARETYKTTVALFRSGNISQTYLNDRELQLTQTKLAVAEAKFNLLAIYSRIVNQASL